MRSRLVPAVPALLALCGFLVTTPPAVSSSPAPAPAAAPATCDGRTVTIDLGQPGHPDPDRDDADVVLGTDGRDQIDTGNGDDVVCAAGGDDDVDGGNGTDDLAGGSGKDRLDGGFGDDAVNGGAGADVVLGFDGKDVVHGGDGPDSVIPGWISVGDAGDRGYGDAGDDVLAAGYDDELLDGGPGVDRASYGLIDTSSGPGVTVDIAITGPQDTVAAGVDTLVDLENVSGTGGADSLYGDGGPNLLEGGDADDLLDARGGTDSCRGEAGTDTFVSCETTDDDPVPSPKCAGQVVTIDLNKAGAPDPDRPRADVVLGTSDADDISTGGGDDVVCGGIGSDDIDGGAGRDLLHGQRGADVLTGGPGRDLLDGGANTPFGNEDWVSYSTSPQGVQVDLRVSGPQRTGAGLDTIRGVKLAFGSSHDDVLHGTDEGTWLIGGDGDDLLLGGAGTDSLEGSAGRDVLRGYGGADYFDIDANAGSDRAYGGAGVDQMDYATPGDRYFGGAGDDRMGAIFYCDGECVAPVRLHGGAGNETFHGSVNNEVFDGGAGRDAVDYAYFEEFGVPHDGLLVDLALTAPQDTGYSGTDAFLGIEKVVGTTYGADHLAGSRRDETLKGGGADDVLAGRGGDDTLDGGTGTDTCDGGGGHNELLHCE